MIAVVPASSPARVSISVDVARSVTRMVVVPAIVPLTPDRDRRDRTVDATAECRCTSRGFRSHRRRAGHRRPSRRLLATVAAGSSYARRYTVISTGPAGSRRDRAPTVEHHRQPALLELARHEAVREPRARSRSLPGAPWPSSATAVGSARSRARGVRGAASGPSSISAASTSRGSVAGPHQRRGRDPHRFGRGHVRSAVASSASSWPAVMRAPSCTTSRGTSGSWRIAAISSPSWRTIVATPTVLVGIGRAPVAVDPLTVAACRGCRRSACRARRRAARARRNGRARLRWSSTRPLARRDRRGSHELRPADRARRERETEQREQHDAVVRERHSARRAVGG